MKDLIDKNKQNKIPFTFGGDLNLNSLDYSKNHHVQTFNLTLQNALDHMLTNAILDFEIKIGTLVII